MCETSYVPEQSDPGSQRYVFSYTITILNEGSEPARLLRRHWLITDANGKVQEVRGDGVVGEQPHLQPGQGFRYSSGAILETPVGHHAGQLPDGNGPGRALRCTDRAVPPGHARHPALSARGPAAPCHATPSATSRAATNRCANCCASSISPPTATSCCWSAIWSIAARTRWQCCVSCARWVATRAPCWAITTCTCWRLHHDPARKSRPGDTLDEVLDAPDREALLDWLIEAAAAHRRPRAW